MKENLKIAFANNRPDNNIIELLKKVATTIEVVDLKKYDGSNKPELLVFTGGEDVDPTYYNENQGRHTHSNRRRDDTEAYNYREFYNIPKFGICRGFQFLTVMNNGKLIQHVTNHTSDHTIQTDDDRVITVTSTHHQMGYPFNLPDKNYKLLAWSQYFKSDTYLDGNNDSYKLSKEFLEPEVIWYPESKSLAIQGHPEYSNASKEFVDYTIELINEYIFDIKPQRKYNLPKHDDLLQRLRGNLNNSIRKSAQVTSNGLNQQLHSSPFGEIKWSNSGQGITFQTDSATIRMGNTTTSENLYASEPGISFDAVRIQEKAQPYDDLQEISTERLLNTLANGLPGHLNKEAFRNQLARLHRNDAQGLRRTIINTAERFNINLQNS